MVVLDTNVIIDHLRLENKQASSLLTRAVQQHQKETLAISILTIQELYAGRSTQDTQKEQHLLATISPLRILPYNYEVAKLAGEIARSLDNPIGLADAAIAATTILSGGTLLTANNKDFSGIKGLTLNSLPIQEANTSQANEGLTTLANLGIRGGPSDLASNLDNYLYGDGKN
jgi:tRNA(fMet)-specific endonuclease VapC